MTAPTHRRFTADEFTVWAMQQPGTIPYELVAGEVVAMSPEQAGHARTKARIWQTLEEALRAAGLVDCEAFIGGMAVRIDDHTIYRPDVLVRCGPRVEDTTVELTDPVIVIEVVAPSSGGRDVGAKLEDYLRLASVRHYLIVKTENRAVIHHRRDATGTIATSIHHEGEITFEAPGLTVRVEDFFPP